MNSIMQKVRETPGIIFQIMDQVFTIKFIKKVFINITLFIIFNISIFLLNVYTVRNMQRFLVDNFYFKTTLSQRINDRQIESYIIFEDTALPYCFQQSDDKQICQNLKKYGDIVELKKALYDFQLEISLYSNQRQENFVYEIVVAMKDAKDNFFYEGFIIPQRKGYVQAFITNNFTEEDFVATKQFSFDFRSNYKPQYAIFKLKMIQNQTFIKDIVLNYKKKSSFIIRMLYNYRYFIYVFSFFTVFFIANWIYLMIFLSLHSYKFLTFIQNLDNEEGYISLKEKAI